MKAGADKSSRGRVLIIDDSELVLDKSKAVLTAAGFEVVTTSQAVGASRHLSSVDLVIIDFHMPGFDGKDMASSMREASRVAKRRCLLYLYTSDEDAMRQHKTLGFDGCFSDKGDPSSLVDQVEAVFRLIQMRGIAGRIRNALDR